MSLGLPRFEIAPAAGGAVTETALYEGPMTSRNSCQKSTPNEILQKPREESYAVLQIAAVSGMQSAEDNLQSRAVMHYVAGCYGMSTEFFRFGAQNVDDNVPVQ